MPELPEVETVRLGLKKLIVGREIKSVDSDWLKSFPNDPKLVNDYVIGATVINIKRRAKILIIGLSTSHSLIVHLKMTGQLVFKSDSERFGAGHPSSSLVGRMPDKTTRVIITFKDGSTLFFNDQRKFGWMKLVRSSQIKSLFTDIYGPEPLSKNFDVALFKERLFKRPNGVIKAALLDQKIIAGVGNIYADESLWAAKIHPKTLVRNLSDKNISDLHHALIEVLELSIKMGGSSDRNYVDAKGQRGSYIKIAKAFRREGSPCFRCGHEIQKIRVASRGTHICPHCQKLKVDKISK